MRQAPGPMPKILPRAADAAAMVEHWANAPRTIFGDLSIRNLVSAYAKGAVWLTGSTVWLPAVFGQSPPLDNDVDLIFESAADCDQFVERVLTELSTRMQVEYRPSESVFGARKLLLPEGKKPLMEPYILASSVKNGVRLDWSRIRRAKTECHKSEGILDAWPLEPGETVAEVLMSYPHDYQRAAYSMDRALAGKPTALTRLARAAHKPEPKRSSAWY